MAFHHSSDDWNSGNPPSDANPFEGPPITTQQQPFWTQEESSTSDAAVVVRPMKRSKKPRKRHIPVGPAGVWFQQQHHQKVEGEDEEEEGEPAMISAPQTKTPQNSFYSPAWMAMQIDLTLVTPSLPSHWTTEQKVEHLRPHWPSNFVLLADVKGWKLEKSLLVLVQAIHQVNDVWTVSLQDESTATMTAWIQPRLVTDEEQTPRYLQVGYVWRLEHATIALHEGNSLLLAIKEENIVQVWTTSEADQVSDQAYISWMEQRNTVTVPEDTVDDGYTSDDHQEAEFDFCQFLQENQTKESTRVDSSTSPRIDTPLLSRTRLQQPQTSRPLGASAVKAVSARPQNGQNHNPYNQPTLRREPSVPISQSQPNTTIRNPYNSSHANRSIKKTHQSQEPKPLRPPVTTTLSQGATPSITRAPVNNKSQPRKIQNPYGQTDVAEPAKDSVPHDFSQFALSPPGSLRKSSNKIDGSTKRQDPAHLSSPSPLVNENATPNTGRKKSSSRKSRALKRSALWAENNEMDWDSDVDDDAPKEEAIVQNSDSEKPEPKGTRSKLFLMGTFEDDEDVDDLFGDD